MLKLLGAGLVLSGILAGPQVLLALLLVLGLASSVLRLIVRGPVSC